MAIANLLLLTARQLLLYRALGHKAPAFFHCALLLDEKGQRLAKPHDALSLRALRANGKTLAQIRHAQAHGKAFAWTEGLFITHGIFAVTEPHWA